MAHSMTWLICRPNGRFGGFIVGLEPSAGALARLGDGAKEAALEVRAGYRGVEGLDCIRLGAACGHEVQSKAVLPA